MKQNIDTNTLHSAYEAWQGLSEWRQRRQRYKRYTYGRQWDDPVEFADGRSLSEKNHAAECGQNPQTNNLIRQLLKCVIGNFRRSLSEGTDDSLSTSTVSEIDKATAQRNCLDEMDSRMLEEFLISGCAVQRVVCERRPWGSGVWVDNLSPENFFVNRYSDPRGHDIELIGALHSMSLREVMMRYGRGDSTRLALINKAYGHTGQSVVGWFGAEAWASEFFRAPAGRCRVIEVWTLESRNRWRCHNLDNNAYYETDIANAPADENVDKRPITSLRWHCRVYAPSGAVLDEYDSPYSHGGHPFALKMYPLIDGEVHSLVEDIIGQQRHINRLITLLDHVLSTAAKGVLLFPTEQKPDGVEWDDIARMWAQPNGVIMYNARQASQMPQQIVNPAECQGAYHMLSTQIDMFQRISGVSDALQGKLPSTGNASAALYDQQLRTATVALLDLLDCFNSFRSQRNRLMLTAINNA